MKQLIKHLKKYKLEVILSPLFKLLEATMDLLVPIFVSLIINEGINTNNKAIIIKYFVILIVLAVLGMLFAVSAQWFAAKAAVRTSSDLKEELFCHIQSFTFKELDLVSPNTLITRITSDINQVQTGLNLALRLVLRSPLIVIGSIIMAFIIDAKSSIVFLISIPLLGVIIYILMKVSIPLFKTVQTKLDGLLKIVRENLSGIRVIRAFNRQNSEIKNYLDRNNELTNLNLKASKLSSLLNPLTYLLINIAIIILIWSAAGFVYEGRINQGDLVALYNYMTQVIIELIKLASLVITINRSIASAKRIEEVLAIQPSLKYNDQTITKKDNNYMVSFNNVSFVYANAKEDAIYDISFDIEKEQTIGIIGGTGSGKSTIINLIPRFYDATKGKVMVDGIDVKDYNSSDLIQKIGIVSQNTTLFKGTIRDNLKLGNRMASDEEIWEALEIAQAKSMVEAKNKMLDDLIEQEGANLSGGQKQRLTIARALIKKPQLLILDDSTSALDYKTDLDLRRGIYKLKDITTIIVSQRIFSVKNADLILVVDKGRIVGKGKHQELLDTCLTYQEIYKSQFPKSDDIPSFDLTEVTM